MRQLQVALALAVALASVTTSDAVTDDPRVNLEIGARALTERELGQAEIACRLALEGARRQADSELEAGAIRCLAVTHSEQGRLDEARGLLEAELERQERNREPARAAYDVAVALASLRERTADRRGAEEAWRRALEIGEAARPRPLSDAEMIMPLQRVAKAAHERGNPVKAAEAVARYEAAMRMTFGDELLAHEPWLARYYLEIGRKDQAEALHKLSIEYLEARLNRPNAAALLASSLENYATFLDEVGRAGEAGKVRRRAEAIRHRLGEP